MTAFYAPFEEAEQRDVCVFLFKHICFLDQRSAIWNCLSARVLQSSLSRVPYFQLTICSETIKNKVFCCHGPNQQISVLYERANKAVFTKLSQNSLRFSIWKWVSQLIDFDKLGIIQSKWILNWWENGESIYRDENWHSAWIVATVVINITRRHLRGGLKLRINVPDKTRNEGERRIEGMKEKGTGWMETRD